MFNDNRIELRPGRMPTLKRFYTEAMAAFLKRSQEDAIEEPVAHDAPVEVITRKAMKELARRLALHPGDLPYLEWRDLERVLREIFEGLGFDTLMTRSSKDGGFDLEVRHDEDGVGCVYLVEVKHWRTKKPGHVPYTAFLEVVVRQGATMGLLLSTSGFTKPLLQDRIELGRQRVRLGGANKVIEFCQRYTRKELGFWEPESTLSSILFEDTL